MDKLSATERDEFARFSNDARTCLTGWNPFLMTCSVMQEKAIKWANRLAEVEQTDNVCLMRAHLMDDIVDMDGRGVWSYTCMSDEDVDWTFEANEYPAKYREDDEFMAGLHSDWANDLWEEHYEAVDWGRARELRERSEQEAA